jgi:hypothetical protein
MGRMTAAIPATDCASVLKAVVKAAGGNGPILLARIAQAFPGLTGDVARSAILAAAPAEQRAAFMTHIPADMEEVFMEALPTDALLSHTTK